MKTRYEKLRKERILAIDPMRQGFGFVVLEAEPLLLVDWGLSLCRRKNNGTCLEAVARLRDRCAPTALVIEDRSEAGTARQIALGEFLDSISDLLSDSRVPVFSYGKRRVRALFNTSSAYTKTQIAELLASRFPELAPRLPRPRQPWQSEDARMSIFESLALALTDLNLRGGSSGDKS